MGHSTNDTDTFQKDKKPGMAHASKVSVGEACMCCLQRRGGLLATFGTALAWRAGGDCAQEPTSALQLAELVPLRSFDWHRRPVGAAAVAMLPERVLSPAHQLAVQPQATHVVVSNSQLCKYVVALDGHRSSRLEVLSPAVAQLAELF